MSRPVRSYNELVGLAEAVFQAPATEQETDYVEWKSVFDLRANAEHRFEVAKHILGFANRHPDRAIQHFAGCAYVVLGIEPQSAVGIDVEDQADVTKWIGQYLGTDGPQWSTSYVKAAGVDVLVVTVEAPQWGESLRTLAKGYNNWAPGQLFIRRAGMTTTPDQAEVRMLEERVRRATSHVAVEVGLQDPGRALRTFVATQQDRENWVNSEGVRLADPYNRDINRGTSLADLARSPLMGESRSRGQYEREMTKYLGGHASQRWRMLIYKGVIRLGLGVVRLKMTNPTDQNFSSVRVVLEPPDTVYPFLDEDDPDRVLKPEEPPLPWGEHSLVRAMPPVELMRSFKSDGMAEVTTNGSQAQVSFFPVALRPRATEPLPPVHLPLPRSNIGDEVVLSWTATSTSADGTASGQVVLPVDKDPVSADELIAAGLHDDD